MGEVVSIKGGREVGFIHDIAVVRPVNGYEYLAICKQFLTVDDYEAVLLAIMDEAYYNNTEKQLCAIVDSYYSFPE
jgi:hypothetical protein